MKNRKLVYILLPVVVIIWGMIIYKIFTWIGGDVQDLKTMTTPLRNRRTSSITDTFTLLLNYHDPFGIRPNTSAITGRPGGKGKSVTKWPAISFYGTVSFGKNKQTLASMQINGNDIIMKPGDTFGEIRLVALNKEGIRVSYHGEIRKITTTSGKR